MTTTQQTKLPPLPEPADRYYVEGYRFERYASNQMLAYGQLCREQALEDAAKKADELDCAHKCGVGSEVGEAIRSMK